MIKRPCSRSSIAASLAGCAVTQPVAAQARPAARVGDRRAERAARALVDRVQRSGADRAGRRGVPNNLDLRAALARIEAARAQVLLAQSYLAPERQSQRQRRALAHFREHVAAAAARDVGRPATTSRVALQVSYELDVWGKYRSGAAGRHQRPRRVALLPRDRAHHRRRRRRQRVLPPARRRRGTGRAGRHAEAAHGNRAAAARPLRRRPHRRVRPAHRRGGAIGGRRRHRAREAGDRPARGRASPR